MPGVYRSGLEWDAEAPGRAATRHWSSSCVPRTSRRYRRPSPAGASYSLFTKLKPEVIKQKLEGICHLIGIQPDAKRIEFIVESASGNMRSAWNTLEQVCQLGRK